MKNKKIFKRGLALLCAAALLIGGFSILATNSKAETVAEQLKADGYTKMTPATFGITEELVYTYESTDIWENHTASSVTSFDKKYLEADISLTKHNGIENRIAYMGKWNIFIYIGWDEFRIWDNQNRTLLYQETMSNLEGTPAAGEYFNIKIATDVSTNASDSTMTDITLKVWVNDTIVKPLSAVSSTESVKITVATNQVTTSLGAYLSKAGTIKIKEHVDEVETPEAPEIPDTLEGFEKMTPATFGITEEKVYTFEDSNIWDPYAATDITSFDKKYLEADISLTNHEGIENRIVYMGQWNLFIYIGWDEFRIFSNQTQELLYQSALSGLELTAGEYFNIKIATAVSTNASDSTKTDITLKVWIEDEVLMPLSTVSSTDRVTVTVASNQVSQSLGANLEAAGTIKIKEHVDEVVEPEEPEESEENVDPNLPEKLVDYKRITPKNFGITKEVVHTYSSPGIWEAYPASSDTSFEKAYFEADISITRNDAVTNAIRYYGKELFLIYSGWNEFRIYSEDTGDLLYQTTLSSVGASSGEYFNLKFATDINVNASDSSKTDVTVTIWINNQLVSPVSITKDYITTTTDSLTITVDSTEITNNLIVSMYAAGTIKIKPRVYVTEGQGERLKDVSYNLSSSVGYLLTGTGTMFVDGIDTAIGTVLTEPGDYVIQRVIGPDEIYIQNLSLYKVGDVNLGGGSEWTADDQGELERIIQFGTTSNAAKKAADINNDGKVAKSDLTLIKKVVKGELTESDVIQKYHAPAVTYDFIGGDSVMPIGGYFGPYDEATITEAIYKAIADSGVNLIVKDNMDYSDETNQLLIKRGLAYARQYGIGVFVSDARLNTVTKDENGLVTENSYVSSTTDLATLLGDYSTYESFLGTTIVDEPISDGGFSSKDAAYYQRFKYYSGITTALNAYDNLTGYVNLLGSYHMRDITYEEYLREVGKNMKLLSFDSYPFFEKNGVSGGMANYLQSLGTVSKVAREDGYPFWSYVQAGTDFRDDGATGSSAASLTQAQTLWNVNTSLAFGAKGIVYFPLVQPSHYAKVDATTFDYDRNGIIGADGKANDYYTMVQTANKQVAAVDEVLMRAVNQGVIVTGQAATDTVDVDSIITSTDKLTSVSGDDAMVGCFTYGETEAFYVVSYDYEATESQTITLNFDGNHQYRLIQGGTTTYGEGSTCTITASAGEGVLVVLEDYVVYYEDISAYRAESGYTAPEVPAGYIFAGWYKDKACTKENAVKKSETEVAAYAKFVDAKLLTVKAQITAGTTADSESTSIRFVTAVNDLNYRKVGFKVNIYKESGVSERDYCDNIVYTKLSVTVDKETTDHKPQKLFCATATFFKAQIINKIPNANFDTKFEVTPYWETLDGTIVYGTTAIKTVRQGIQ